MGGVRWSFWLVKGVRGGQDCTLAPPPTSWCWPSVHAAAQSPPHTGSLLLAEERPGASPWAPQGCDSTDTFHLAPAAKWCDPACGTPCPALLGFCCHQPAPFLKRGARFRKGAPVVCLLGMGLLCVGSPTSPPLEHPVLASVPRPRDTTAGRIFLATAESRITSHPGGS